MILRLLSAALAAGFLAAVVATGLQLALTSPLIIEAERYEQRGASHAAEAFPVVHAHIVRVHSGHDHGTPDAAPEWQPAPGFQRMAFTGLATLVGGVGYALAGFASFALAPSLGLPPELPGQEAAPLLARQAWWVMTAAATGMGLYLIGIRRSLIAILGGLVLIVTPHIVGAPPPPAEESALPAALAAQFAARSLAIGAVFWAMIGLGFGWAWQVFDASRSRHA
jgi:predicted cobalt transporter CbtA